MVKINLIKEFFEKNLVNLSIEEINKKLKEITGIQKFFNNDDEYSYFRNIILENDSYEIEKSGLEHGDYQTPKYFTDKVCKVLKENYGCNPEIIVEPTFGIGNFITSSVEYFKNTSLVCGVELQDKYVKACKLNLINELVNISEKKPDIKLYQENIFDHKFEEITSQDKEMLIIGNPPWVTNSHLAALNSSNLPQKSNFKKMKGLDAIMGKANFDIAEYIVLQMINRFKEHTGTIAMLVKNTVARNIVRDLKEYDFDISDIRIYEFNAKEVFNASCEAALFVAKIEKGKKDLKCDVYNIDDVDSLITTFGWSENGNFISDINKYENMNSIDGKCHFEWRQGIKHDASKVMQLTIDNRTGNILNGNKINVDVEEEYLYNHLKSSDLKRYEVTTSRKKVIVTQKKVGEDTDLIRINAPNLWKYLEDNSEKLDNRKSSIYKNAPRFAIFGIGDYSFKPYKVAKSGMYKHTIFSLVHPVNNRPMMLDDTCYFLSFDNYKEALITMTLLNSNIVGELLNSIAFLNAKRPYTKEVLMRIDLAKVAECITFEDIMNFVQENNIELQESITSEDYEDYKNNLLND